MSLAPSQSEYRCFAKEMIIHGSKVEKVSAEDPDEGSVIMLQGHIMIIALTLLSFHWVPSIYYKYLSYHIIIYITVILHVTLRITLKYQKRQQGIFIITNFFFVGRS